MRVLIIGAGNAGKNIIGRFCGSHDVVVIDHDPAALKGIDSAHDALTIHGDAASPRVLEEAGISKAKLVVALSNRDEINIVACAYAKAAGVEHKVARISNNDFLKPDARLNLKEMGVDLAVSHKEATALEVFGILRNPGSQQVIELLDGKALALGLTLESVSPLITKPLKEFRTVDEAHNVRFISAKSGDKPFIPDGNTQFIVGDKIHAVMTPAEVQPFMDWANPEHPRFEKIIVGGGGDLGLGLALRLEGAGPEVVLVEEDEQRAEFCSTVLRRTLVICGNLLDQETIEQVGDLSQAAYAGVTGNDEINIISCLLAEQNRAAFSLAIVTKPEYGWILETATVDRAVNPHEALGNAILHFVSGQNLMQSSLLHNMPGELLEFVLPKGSALNGKSLQEISFPKGAIVATVQRGENVYAATGDLVLHEDDHIVVFALSKVTQRVEALFSN